MSLPRSHLRRLEQDLRVHEDRAGHLRQQIGLLEQEAAAHERIVRLGRDGRILAALGELSADPDLVDRLSADPAAFVHERSIELPAGARVEALRDEGRTTVSVQLEDAGRSYSCVWDSADGFALVQHDQAGAE
jgi:hypothetical protein